MTEFFTDLWEDLREKRLWPVAAVLLLAIAAAPVVFSGSDSSTSGSRGDPASPVASTAQVPAVASVEDDLAGDSDLGAYGVKDPFRSGLPKAKGGDAAGVAVPIGGGKGAAGGGSTGSGAATGGSTGGSAAGGGSTGGGSGGSGSTGSAPSTDGPGSGSTPTRSKTRVFTYVADLTFGRRGSTRRLEGVKRMRMLPSSRNPLLVFLGVSSDRKKAVFLVDEALSHSGEGVCRPRVSQCKFLFLRTSAKRNEHFFTTEAGVEYVLKLRDIRAVRVRPRAKKSANASAFKRKQKRSLPRFADDAK